MAVAARVDSAVGLPAGVLAGIARVEEAMRLGAPPLRTHVGRMAAYHLGRIDADGRPAHGSAGKMLRGGLCVWVCEALGGVVADAIDAAVALEWIHNFTLIHDDIQDGDTQRRHRPALWTVVGTAQGINAGDGLHALATALLTRPGRHPGRRLRAAHAVGRGVEAVVEGQCIDLALDGQCSSTLPTYLGLARAKTGALFGAALEAGALLAGRPVRDAAALRMAGIELGAAFQVRDDWLGSFGDPALTGKPCGADLRRRKLTAVVVAAHGAGGRAERRLFRELFARDDSEATAMLVALVHRLGGPSVLGDLPESLTDAALAAGSRSGLPAAALDELGALAHFAIGRMR